ncbi:universal stress protein [Aquifex pyrophilus]
MKALLVFTDTFSDCERALRFAVDFTQKLNAELEILVVLEDLYHLERGSTTFGMPVPPDVKNEAVRRVERKLKENWEKYASEGLPSVSYKVGPLHEEVKRFVEGKEYQLIMWACYPSAYLCKIIDDLNTASLIIK